MGPKAERVKLEKHFIPTSPEKLVMVWMVALPSETVTDVSSSSAKKYTSILVEM